MRQGMHHSAQKSTRTGWSDLRTSASKLVSVNSTMFLLVAINVFSYGAMIGGSKRGVNERSGRCLSQFLLQMFRQPEAQGDQGQRGIGVATGRENRAPADEEICNFVGSTIGIDDALFWV